MHAISTLNKYFYTSNLHLIKLFRVKSFPSIFSNDIDY